MRGMTIDGMLLNTMQSQRQSGDRKKKKKLMTKEIDYNL